MMNVQTIQRAIHTVQRPELRDGAHSPSGEHRVAEGEVVAIDGEQATIRTEGELLRLRATIPLDVGDQVRLIWIGGASTPRLHRIATARDRSAGPRDADGDACEDGAPRVLDAWA